MNSGLAVACVTAVLKNLLENSLIEKGLAAQLGDAQVSALPPDRVSIGADERSQLNLFLYRLTPNTSRNETAAKNGHTSKANGSGRPPGLLLDMHYLVTAYGEQDLVAEILLGMAMQVFHSIPTLDAGAVRSALAIAAPNGRGAILSPGRSVLAAASKSTVVRQLSITPEFLGTEELSRIWSALQARYRPSATYKVSAALIEAEK